jgi:hypothetical protein
MQPPSERRNISDNLRRLSVAEARDPIDNAFWAFAALSDDGKAEMARRFNDNEAKRAHPRRLDFNRSE